MLAQRGLGLAVRRFAGTPSNVNRQGAMILASTSAPLPTQTRQSTHCQVQRRSATTSAPNTTKIHPDAATEILTKQRLARPVAPHLTIYRPQITWTLSALNRITGSILSGGLYVFGAAYLVAPLMGWHLESASMAAAVAGWPLLVKGLAKFLIAWPVAFHSLNGVRHLVWDMGRQIGNLAVQKTGWAVLGASTVVSLGLAFM